MLEIRNLQVSVDGQEILRGIDLDVRAGSVHAIMGPNGSGKSTLASVLAGRDGYEITAGTVTYGGQDLLEMDPEIRARELEQREAQVEGRMKRKMLALRKLFEEGAEKVIMSDGRVEHPVRDALAGKGTVIQ